MGNGGIAAVSDAGPLVRLAEINATRILRVFEYLHIPETVWGETVGRNRTPEKDLLALGRVQRHVLSSDDVGRFMETAEIRGLHAGESES